MNKPDDPYNQIEKRDKALFDSIALKYAQKDVAKSTVFARRYQLLYAVDPIFKDQIQIGTLIEIACGVGASARYLHGKYNKYIGIDHSEKMIEAAKLFNRDIPEADFVYGNVKTIEIAGHNADLILAVGALHHMTDLNDVMKSLRRIAKPSGYFVAIEPQSGNPFIQLLRFLRGKLDREYSKDQRYFTRSELRNIMSNNGMTDVEIEYQGYFSPPFAQVVLVPAFLIIPLSRLVVWLDYYCDKYLPGFLKSLSWNLVIRARFP